MILLLVAMSMAHPLDIGLSGGTVDMEALKILGEICVSLISVLGIRIR